MTRETTTWAATLPAGWRALPLRRVAGVRNSNVDKLSSTTEQPVRLCNYVDVYRNNRITDALAFMRATATRDEIERFRLQRGDVLLTKDSEAWSDIGVPALVEAEAPDLVCGYHLTMLRPRAGWMMGSYLNWALQSAEVALQFHLAAKGVTRFGLSQGAIKSALIPAPPLPQQAAIVKFLDNVEMRTSLLMKAQQDLLRLLDEATAVLRWDALTTPAEGQSATVRPAAAWMGEVPDDWDTLRLKTLFRETDRRSTSGTETLLSLRMREGLVPASDFTTKPQDPLQLTGYKIIEPGQLVMNRMRASIGVFDVAARPGLVSPDYATFEVRRPVHLPYLLMLLKSPQMGAVMRAESRGMGTGQSGFLRLYTDRFGAIPIVLPPLHEQQNRAAEAQRRTEDLRVALEATLTEIALLKEYRTRLIADVVTGRRDVQAAAASLPDVDPHELAVVVSATTADDGDGDEEPQEMGDLENAS